MILVTGGTGLVGSHLLLSLLQEGKKVRALKRATSNIENVLETFKYYTPAAESLFKKIEWYDAGILDLEKLSGAMDSVEEIYHCAAFVSFVPTEKKKTLDTNIKGTANLVKLSLENKIRKFCFVSSTAALGNARGGEEVNEETPRDWSVKNSVYSQSKYQSEQIVWKGIKKGLQAVIVNPAIIIGPGNWQRGSASIFTNIHKGMKFYTGGITGYVDVNDVVKCMRQLMEKNRFGERFTLVSENRSYKDVFFMVADALGVKRPSIKANPFLGGIAWRASTLGWILFRKPPVITRETVRAGFNKVYFSNKKIKNTCNMEFVPLEKSIQKTARFFISLLIAWPFSVPWWIICT